MPFARIIRIVFGVVAGVMLVAAIADILWSGHLTLIPRFSFGALVAVALAFLLTNILSSREREEMLLRVAQEALANVVKHAAAHEVSVRVAALAGEVVLTVQDNGRGFDARSAVRAGAARSRPDGGMGLASMRDRIRGQFGQLIVESAPGLGTTVEARLPR